MIEIELSGAKGALNDLIRILEVEGKCPSVLGSYNELSEILSHVTLEEHSYNVMFIMLEKFKAIMLAKRFEFLLGVPEIVFSGLGHDLGKLLRLSGSSIGRYDHPRVSADAVADIFKRNKCSPPWLGRVISAILTHHSDYTPKECDSLVKPLREADWEARTKEVETVRSRSNGR